MNPSLILMKMVMGIISVLIMTVVAWWVLGPVVTLSFAQWFRVMVVAMGVVGTSLGVFASQSALTLQMKVAEKEMQERLEKNKTGQ